MKDIRVRLKRILQDESGQAVVLAAAGMVVILGFAGLALDIGQMRYEKRQLQAAADAAALSAALEISACSGTSDCSAMMTAAEQAMTENGLTVSGGNVLEQCASGSTTALTLTVNNGPCALGSTSSDPNYGSKSYVEVVVAEPQNTFFARVLGINAKTISARSEATQGNSQFCFYTSTLPSTQSQTGMLLNGGTINASCGIMDDSSSGYALSTDSGVNVTSTVFDVNGGWSPDNGGTYSSTPKLGVAQVSDPLSYLSPPTVGGCLYSGNYLPSNGQILNPGNYCGGINLNNGVSVTLSAGNYYFGGPVNVGTGDTLTGSAGVLLYFYSGSLTMNSGSKANLVAQTTGPYAGILIYQNPSDSSSIILDGNTTSKWEGAIYAVDANLTFNSTGNAAAYTIIDVGSLTLNSGSDLVLNTNYSSLGGGSPLKAGAMLAE